MPATKTIAGVVGALGLVGCLVAAAQVQADECSGLMCIFQSRPAPQPVAAPQAVPSAEPVADAMPRPKPKAKPRPVPGVTIAASPAEVARLKVLAAVMPRPRVRLVAASA